MDVQEHVDSSAPTGKGTTPRTRRSKAATAPKSSGKRSLNLRIDDDSYKRLSIHALMRGATISDLVMEYAQSLREYSMPHRLGGRGDATEGQGGE